MAFSLDFDIYNWLLSEILKVQPTGDPVNDAVYLVLLPMVVLFMFVNSTIGRSRFAEHGVKYVIMFVAGFFIVREGFYPIFAGFSLPLLILIMLWYSFDFIRGKSGGSKGGNKGGEEPAVRRGAPGRNEIEEDDGLTLRTLAKFIDDVKHPGRFGSGLQAVEIEDINELMESIERSMDAFSRIAGSYNGDKRATEIVIKLDRMYNKLERIKKDVLKGRYRGDLEKEVEEFRDELTSILNEEKKFEK